jgi:hypothetical protein
MLHPCVLIHSVGKMTVLNVEQWKQIAPYNFFILVYERKETLSFLFISGKRHHFDFE